MRKTTEIRSWSIKHINIMLKKYEKRWLNIHNEIAGNRIFIPSEAILKHEVFYIGNLISKLFLVP